MARQTTPTPNKSFEKDVVRIHTVYLVHFLENLEVFCMFLWISQVFADLNENYKKPWLIKSWQIKVHVL